MNPNPTDKVHGFAVDIRQRSGSRSVNAMLHRRRRQLTHDSFPAGRMPAAEGLANKRA
jgi:hypothetical protein